MKTASLAPMERPAIAEQVSGPRNQSLRSAGRHSRALAVAFAMMLLALLSACSSDSKPAEEAKPEVKGPELITARSAFQKLYVAARGWNQDAKPYRIESTATSDGK